MFGDYFGIRRDYPVEEWINDVKPQGVTKSVHVTAMWGPGRALDETRWLQSVADKHGFPHGIVCNADLADPDVEGSSRRRNSFRICAACARCCIGTANPCGRPRRGRISATRPNFRRGFALLEKYDLHFELQVYAGQATYAVELIKAFPNVRMILVHAGMLTARTPVAIDQWRAALTMMAAFPNVHVKLSGLGMYSNGVTLPQARQVIRDLDPDLRRRAHDLRQQFPARKAARQLCGLSSASIARSCRNITEADQRTVLHDNAVKFYRLY